MITPVYFYQHYETTFHRLCHCRQLPILSIDPSIVVWGNEYTLLKKIASFISIACNNSYSTTTKQTHIHNNYICTSNKHIIRTNMHSNSPVIWQELKANIGLQSRSKNDPTRLCKSLARSWGWIICTSLLSCFLSKRLSPPLPLHANSAMFLQLAGMGWR